MGGTEAGEAETQPAEEGVAPAGEAEELRDGLVREGWLRWTCALRWHVAAKEVKPGRGGLAD